MWKPAEIMKVKCNAVQRFISDYIDKTLSTRDTTKVETHLQNCHKCQREVEALKKTRDLVVDFYVEPDAPDSYFHQFQVRFQQSIENNGPLTLNERIKSSIVKLSWSFLTQLRQSFERSSFARMNALPLGVLLSFIVTGFVATHFLKQNVSPPPKEYPRQVGETIAVSESATIDEQSKLQHRSYNDSQTKRKTLNEVSSSTLATETEKVGYWKLAEPLTTETDGHIIVLHVSNERSVPIDTADSELIVYAQTDILSRKSPLKEEIDLTALPLELQVTSFSEEKSQRKQRKTSRAVNKLMNVSSNIPTITKPYDLGPL